MCVLIGSLLTKKLKGARTRPKTTQTVSLCIRIYFSLTETTLKTHTCIHTRTHACIHDDATLDTKQTVRTHDDSSYVFLSATVSTR